VFSSSTPSLFDRARTGAFSPVSDIAVASRPLFVAHLRSPTIEALGRSEDAHQTDDSKSSNNGIAVFASFAAGSSPKTLNLYPAIESPASCKPAYWGRTKRH
jgi:hypothetical protein